MKMSGLGGKKTSFLGILRGHIMTFACISLKILKYLGILNICSCSLALGSFNTKTC